MADLTTWPLVGVVALFAGGAVLVWRSGSLLAVTTDLIGSRFGIGNLLAGLVFLGIATSLPELATTLTAAARGAAAMAASNLLGGVAMQIALLAIVDGYAAGRKPLTMFAPDSSLMVAGVFLLVALAVTGMAIVSNEWVVAGASPWSWGLAVLYVVSVGAVRASERKPGWKPAGETYSAPTTAQDLHQREQEKHGGKSTRLLMAQFGMSAAGVLAGGYGVARSGEAIAVQTDIDQSLVGAVLVAVATSLPEISTTLSAVRIGAYAMAVGNILGTNTLELALFLPADLAHSGGSVLNALAPRHTLLVQLGSLLTCIYLWGVLERRNRTIGPFGVDSAMVMITYLAGMALFAATTTPLQHGAGPG